MNAIKAFMDKYNAVLVRPGHSRPDYTCKLSTLPRLLSIAAQLAESYKTAAADDRAHIARDLSDLLFEVNVRWSVSLAADSPDWDADRAFIRLVGIHTDLGLKWAYTTEQMRAEADRRVRGY